MGPRPSGSSSSAPGMASRHLAEKLEAAGGGRSGGGGSGGGLRNPCLTMHQPWASLLVHGIKRMDGRSWPSQVTGRLWIHAASKVPDHVTVAAMEDFYWEIHAIDGVDHIDSTTSPSTTPSPAFSGVSMWSAA